jgi:hypothetical protein
MAESERNRIVSCHYCKRAMKIAVLERHEEVCTRNPNARLPRSPRVGSGGQNPGKYLR